MTLRDYANVVRRRKWFVIVPAAVITVVAVLYSLTQDDRYRASADVLVQEVASSTSVNDVSGTASNRLINNELERAQGSAMQDVVEEVIGTEPDLDVKLARDKDVDVLIFTATSADAAFAAQAANTYANAYAESRRNAVVAELAARLSIVQGQLDAVDAEIEATLEVATTSLSDQRDELQVSLDALRASITHATASFIDDLTRRLAILQGQLNAIDSEIASTRKSATSLLSAQREKLQLQVDSLETSITLADTSGTSVIDAAQVPEAPFSPRPARTGILALVVGIMVGLGVAFLVDYLDNSLRDEEGLAKASGLPVLAVIPKLEGWETGDHPHVITIESPLAPSTEAYRGLRTSMQFLGLDRKLKIVQVTSPKPGDGKTTTAVNLAVAHANAGQKVVLVDCDLRKPRVHGFFDLPNERGVTTALVEQTAEILMQSIVEAPNLRIITSGPIPPDPSELLGGVRATRFFRVLSEQFDLVILDTPPALVVSDPLVVSKHVDGVLLVASAQSTDTRQVKRASEMLAQVEAPALGTVLNAFDTDKNKSYEYRYAYGVYES